VIRSLTAVCAQSLKAGASSRRFDMPSVTHLPPRPPGARQRSPVTARVAAGRAAALAGLGEPAH
jgi:hypothetical protein